MIRNRLVGNCLHWEIFNIENCDIVLCGIPHPASPHPHYPTPPHSRLLLSLVFDKYLVQLQVSFSTVLTTCAQTCLSRHRVRNYKRPRKPVTSLTSRVPSTDARRSVRTQTTKQSALNINDISIVLRNIIVMRGSLLLKI